MFKKLVLLTVVVLSVLSLPVRAFWKDEITMLVVPAEKNPVQIAQDISRRYPVLIVSYELVKGKWELYAWDDEKWIPVPAEDYTSGTFFANRPEHTIIVEHERFRAPDLLTPNSIWCESAARISSTDPRVMIHLLGLHFDFPYRHWNQLAERYGYELEEINPTLENVHWWNIRGDALIEKRAKRDFSVDQDKWHDLATLPPPAIEPVMLEKEPVIPEVEKPAVEPVVPAAGAVNITVKAPETPAEKAPVAKPAPAETKPLPSVKPEPVIKPVPEIKPAPPVEQAPAVETAPAPAPLVEAPAVPATVAEIKREIEAVVPAAEPVAVEADPFTMDEIPAAEIVVPQEPKKPWWKLF
jgi:hypothetical protein